MKYSQKAKDPAFWAKVRRDPAYRTFVDRLLASYEKLGREPIREISYDAFMHYHRTGTREVFEGAYMPRRTRMRVCATLALIFPEEETYLRELMNVIWAICGEYCWSLPNHTEDSEFTYNDDYIDLCTAETGYALAQICTLLEDRLDSLVRQRIHHELDRRVIRSFIHHSYGWEFCDNNWAAVCAGGVAGIFLYECPEKLPLIRHRIEASLRNYLSGFKSDGVCREGLAYWSYGFIYFMRFAQQLFEFTDGGIDLFADEHVRAIAAFPAVMFPDGRAAVSFSDGSRQGSVSMTAMTLLATHYGDGLPMPPAECLGLGCGIDDLLWFDPEVTLGGSTAEATYYMEASQWFIKKSRAYGFAAKGGDNAESHNHNDLGSFILTHRGRQVLTDLGIGEYTRDYFGDKRYEALNTRSGGHSVPIVDGAEQAAGSDYRAELTFDGEAVRIDLTHAYPAVRRLEREFTFAEDRVCMTDRFEAGAAIRERLVTQIEPVAEAGAVRLDEVVIRFDPAWEASVTKSSYRDRSCMEEIVWLIDFVPKHPVQEFNVIFECRENAAERSAT